MTKISNNYQIKNNKTEQWQSKPAFCGAPISISPKIGNKLTWLNEKFGTPGQRVVIGATALLFQPTIDYFNNKVDEKTRQSSACRSFSRAIIGTISGIAVRGSCIKLGQELIKDGKYCCIEALKKASPDQIKNYSSAVGNALALAVLLFTNFAFDVPLINKMSQFLNEKVFGNKPPENSNKEVEK